MFRAGVREVRSHHVLGLILIVALLYGMASEGWIGSARCIC